MIYLSIFLGCCTGNLLSLFLMANVSLENVIDRSFFQGIALACAYILTC